MKDYLHKLRVVYAIGQETGTTFKPPLLNLYWGDVLEELCNGAAALLAVALWLTTPIWFLPLWIFRICVTPLIPAARYNSAQLEAALKRWKAASADKTHA